MTPTTTTATMTTATGERPDLLGTLATHRGLLRLTVRDLTDEQAARRTTASDLCLGGLIKHVAGIERQWVAFVAGGPADMGNSEENVNAYMDGFRMLDGETLAGLLDDYEKAAAETDALVVALPDLDVSHPLPAAP